MPQRVWSGPHEKAELRYRQVTMIPTVWWKNNCRFFYLRGAGLNEHKSMKQMVWVHSCARCLPLNRCTPSPGWVQGQHRQDSRSTSSAHNSNLPGRAEVSECCQTTERSHYAATKRSFKRCEKCCASLFVQQGPRFKATEHRMRPKRKDADVPLALHTVQSLLVSSCGPHRSAGSPTRVEDDVALKNASTDKTPPSVALAKHSVIVLTGFRSLCAYPWLCT